MQTADTQYDAHQLRLIAVHSFADPRSVARVLRGERIRTSVAQRVLAAEKDLQRRGKLPPREE